jgi:hypothetical protein
MTSAANYFDISYQTISRYLDKDIPYNDLFYKSEIKNKRIWVHNPDYKLLNIFDSVKKASIFYSIPYSTIDSYIRSGKLYKNKFYFYNISYTSNPYFKD